MHCINTDKCICIRNIACNVWKEEEIQLNILQYAFIPPDCTANPKIDAEGTDKHFTHKDLPLRFKPWNVLTNNCKDTDDGLLYWLTPNYKKNIKLVVDLSCVRKVTGVELRNTNNGKYKGRATKKYSVEVSEDKKAWKEVLSDELLEDSSNKLCNKIPVHKKTFKPTVGRYVRFTMKDFYGKHGGGLQYFKPIVEGGYLGEKSSLLWYVHFSLIKLWNFKERKT